MAKRNPSRPQTAEFSKAEQLLLLLESSSAARWAGLAIISVPALFVVALFWWNVRTEDVAYQNRRAAVAPGIVASVEGVAAPAPTPDSPLMPAEFDRQDGMLLGCNELVIYHPRLMVQMIQAMAGKLEIYGLINDAIQQQKVVSLLEENGLPADTVQFLEITARGMWVRDFGPKFIRNQSGGLTIVDYAYLDRIATDGRVRPDDDKVPARIAELFHMPVMSLPLSMEGGNVLTNGYGLCITTNHLVAENEHRSYSFEKVGQLLGEAYGQRQWSYIDPLPGDPTKHADTYVTFLSPTTVVVGSCDAALDPAAAATMDKTAGQLTSVTVNGQPLQIVRIPMVMKGDGISRTYANCVLANGTALIPQYADVDPSINKQALDIYARVLPNWKIVGIECLELAVKGGALHCVTCNVPSPSLLPLELPAP
ncbi:MAG: agmatine deiminase family protein [Planctomycetia bacterium]|nr:agmatine deiminase family protein [Planctomycetia bacterium]